VSRWYRAAFHARALLHRVGYDVVREPGHSDLVPALRRLGIEWVLDVGANTGQFGAALRRAGYRGHVHSVEPIPAAYAALQRRSAPDPHWTTERAAVSGHSGTVELHVSANSVSSSVLPMLPLHTAAAPGSRYVGTEEVAATTVDDLLTRLGTPPERTLVKIDVQGHESAVLDGAAKSLDRIAGIRTELSLVALYEGQALLPELVERLGRHGLPLWFVEPGFRDPVTRRMLQLDGTFLRQEQAL
jgi:FkbM family methyltransferase